MKRYLLPLFGLLLLVSACQPVSVTAPPVLTPTSLATLEPTYAAQIAAMRSPDVPALPFADNPDPSQCGIPVQWGPNGRAYLTGEYEGALIQPTVFLYDSHSRFEITGQAEHGTAVDIILYQQNPTLDYYFVKVVNSTTKNEGWVPAPFLSFEPLQN